MSGAVLVERSVGESLTPQTLPLAKGRDRERWSSLAAKKAVRWGSMIVVLIAAALGVSLTRYEVVARLIVTTGAVAMMLQLLRARQFAFAAAFGVIAAFFNPMAPAFDFSGSWEGVFVAAGTIPFIAPLVWSNEKESCNA